MDKEWMHLPSRLLPEYAVGVEKFIEQARFYAKTREVILCPCMHCKNKKYKKFDQVYEDLIIKGMDPSYTTWIFHGETSTSQSQGDCSLGDEEDGGENREAYNLFTDAFDPDEEAGHNTNDAEIPLFPEDGEVTRVQVWVQGHKNKDRQPNTHDAADKINEIQQCPPESQNTNVIAEDALSLVFGKEARGRVRGMGFGVTPSKVGAQHQNNIMVNKLQNEVRTLNEKYDELKSMFLAQASGQQTCQEQATNDGVVNGTGNGVNVGCVNDDIPQSNQSNMPNGRIRENTKCKLLNWSNGVGVVAEGRVASTDPKAKVHHIPLGASCWKVWIDRVIREGVELLRPNDEMTILDHARGSTVAWPSKDIILDD